MTSIRAPNLVRRNASGDGTPSHASEASSGLMDVSVVTPGLYMLDYLKRCHGSFADQRGVMLEHIVVDGGSTDGTTEWLRNTPELAAIVAPDDGMYDAIVAESASFRWP